MKVWIGCPVKGSQKVWKLMKLKPELERVPNKILKKSMDCPICGNPFLEDEYPLVVRLPCNRNHMFDLECIAPWLKLHATCPLDRKDLVKEKAPPPPPKDEEEDGEWDDIYA